MKKTHSSYQKYACAVFFVRRTNLRVHDVQRWQLVLVARAIVPPIHRHLDEELLKVRRNIRTFCGSCFFFFRHLRTPAVRWFECETQQRTTLGHTRCPALSLARSRSLFPSCFLALVRLLYLRTPKGQENTHISARSSPPRVF